MRSFENFLKFNFALIVVFCVQLFSFSFAAEKMNAGVSYDFYSQDLNETIQNIPNFAQQLPDISQKEIDLIYFKNYRPLNMLSNWETYNAAARKGLPILGKKLEEMPLAYDVSSAPKSEDLKKVDYEELIKQNPKKADYMYAYAIQLKDDRNYKKALAYVDEAIKIRPDFALSHYLKADILRYFGQYGNSVREYILTININPYCTDAYYNVARIFEQFNQRELALDYYKYAYSTNPDDFEIRNTIIKMQQDVINLAQ